jgi:hypothetical protein
MYEGKGIDRAMFNACKENTLDAKKYKLGAKPPLYSDSASWDESDCSGFSRWILSRTLDKFTDAFPDGSANQHEWCSNNSPKASYAVVLQDRTNNIYMAFMDQVPGTEEVTRHVWFVQNGATIECCGGEGVCSSQEHAQEYASRCSGCYLISSYLP